MSDPGHCPSESEIVEALNTAVLENYYEDMVEWPDSDIATDLWLYHPDIDCEVKDPRLLAGIKAWRDQMAKCTCKFAIDSCPVHGLGPAGREDKGA